MASDASLAHRLVFIDERTTLLCVTLEAGFVSSHESKAAGSDLLLNVCWGALDRDAFVRFMTIAAAHLAFEDRMMMRQLKCCANIQVTLETSVWRFSRVDNRALSAASLYVQTPRAVARLATHIHRRFCGFGAAFCSALTYDHLFRL
jgi:hypothetical protein